MSLQEEDYVENYMEVVASELSGAPLFQVAGEVDHGNMAPFRDAIDVAIGSGANIVLIDLSDVTYIDSGGLSVLYTAVRRLKDRGWLGVINPTTDVRRLLDIIGLTVQRSFRVFADPEEAEEAVQEERV